jgi:hypothetical protein
MGIKDIFLSYEDVIFEHEQKRIEESMGSNQDLCKSVLNLSTNLKNRNCIIRGEESKREELSHAICIDLKKDRTNLIYMASVNDNFKSDDAWRSIKKKSKYGKLYFIIEDCHNNVEEVHKLLDVINQSQNLTNARFLFVLQEGEATKELFSENLYAVVVQATGKNLEEKTQIEESALMSITPETLRKAEKDAQEILQELEYNKTSYGVDSDEYLEYCNAEAFIAHLPEWKHLYMREYGAFPRPDKENQILGDMTRNIQKFARKRKGLMLHVISGDSGCGKSALVKLVLLRLIDKQNLEEFHYLLEILPWIRIFELGEKKDWGALEKAVSMNFQQAVGGNEFIYLVYFDDDLFNLEEEEIYKLLGIFKRASDTLQIYFLTTSPSWIFSQRDLDDNRKKFGLVASRSTPIGGLDDDDRKALKAQSQAMYGEICRSDLLELIDSEEETLILLKLALHQNLTYSEYLESMFHKLKTKQPKYLAALNNQNI